MDFIFKQTKELEGSLDEFLDAISESGLAFKQGLKEYLRKDFEGFNVRIQEVDNLEDKADNLRKNIESRLYSHSLIPEQRGDVLALLETLDDIIDKIKETLIQLDIERPNITDDLHDLFTDLVKVTVLAEEEVVKSSRAFFKDIKSVKDHLHKVNYYEKEADRISDKLKRQIFNSKLELSNKMHLRYFANNIADISDAAEAVGDRLAIYTIKRMI